MSYSELERAIDRYIAHKKAEGLAKSTTDDMRYRIRRFIRECGFESFESIDEQTTIDWFTALADIDPITKKTKASANTRKLYSVYVGGFFEWAVFNDLIATNPCARAPRPRKFKKDRRKFRRALTELELEKLILVARLRPMAEYAKMRIIGSRNQDYWKANPITLENIESLAEDCELLTADVEKMRIDGLNGRGFDKEQKQLAADARRLEAQVSSTYDVRVKLETDTRGLISDLVSQTKRLLSDNNAVVQEELTRQLQASELKVTERQTDQLRQLRK